MFYLAITTSISALLIMPKPFDCVDHNKLWKILKEMGIPDHLICLLRNLYVGQEATVRTGHGTTDWFQIGQGVRQGCILSPCLFNLYAVYIMRNTGLEEAQAGIKIARRNINNLRYADDTTLMAESEEELKSHLMKVKKESEKVGLKLNIQKMKIMASGPITSWEIDEETVETVSHFIFGTCSSLHLEIHLSLQFSYLYHQLLNLCEGIFLVVQWLGVCIPSAESLSSIPGRELEPTYHR